MARFRIQSVSGAEPDLIEALVEIYRQAFPSRMQDSDPHRYFAEALETHSHLNIVAEDEKGTVAGYLLGIPQDEVFEELSPWDPQMRNDPECLYVEIIQVAPIFRGCGLSRRLLGRLCAEAGKRNARKIALHARTTNGWNRRLCTIFISIRTLRRIENWFGSGEPFDYVEATPRLRTTERPREHSQGKDSRPSG